MANSIFNSEVTFNGIRANADLGLIVQFIPPYVFPEKEYQTINIPGRNGDLVLDKGSYRNIEVTYSFAKVFDGTKTFVQEANKIVSWLHSAKGYAILSDTYEPDYYRMAMYRSGGEMSNFYDTATVLDVTFECKPQKYLFSGDTEISVSNGSTITNEQAYDANPVISMRISSGRQNISIAIQDCEIQIVATYLDTGTLIVDCENKECYLINNQGYKTSCNQNLTLVNGKFPVLVANTVNTISITSANDVKIKPRWWTL